MVGSMKVAVDFGALARDWAAYENPVQRANNNVRANAPLSKATAIPGLVHPRDQGRVRAHGVQIAGHDHRCAGRILLCVRQHFVKLE